MATGGQEPSLTDKHLNKVAKAILPQHMVTIAIEYLDISRVLVEICRDDATRKANSTLEFHYTCLENWRNRQGIQVNTRAQLYRILLEASNAGLLYQKDIEFLKDPNDKELPPKCSPGNGTYKNVPRKAPKPAPSTLVGDSTDPERTTKTHNEKLFSMRNVSDAQYYSKKSGIVSSFGYGTQTQDEEDMTHLYQSKMLSVESQSTITTDLYSWQRTKFCSFSDGKYAIFGKKNADEIEETYYYLYSAAGKKTKRLNDVCGHKTGKNCDLISLTDSESEYLIIACGSCNKIYTLNIETCKFRYYDGGDLTFGPICRVGKDKVYAVARELENPKVFFHLLKVYVKDKTRSSASFTRVGTVDTGITEEIASMIYLESHDSIAFLEEETNRCRAVCCKTGEILWHLPSLIDGSLYVPRYLAVARIDRDEGLLVSDGTDTIHVFSVRYGSYRHAVNPAKFGSIAGLGCMSDSLTVLHHKDNISVMSLFKIKYDFDSPA